MKVDTGKLRITPAANNRVLSMGAGDPRRSNRPPSCWPTPSGLTSMPAKARCGRRVAGAGRPGGLPGRRHGSGVGARGMIPEDHPHYFHLFDMQTTAWCATRRTWSWWSARGWVSTTAGACHRPGAIRRDRKPSRSTRTLIHRREPAGRSGHRSRCRAALAALLQAVQSKVGPRATMPDLIRYREQSAAMLRAGCSSCRPPAATGSTRARWSWW